MLLLIDNYDSFSYNLYQLLGELGAELQVIRNDAMTVAEIEALKPAGIILSPGPGRPCDAGVCEAVVRELAGKQPILGVCLGHQAIGEVYGATVSYCKELMHGKSSKITVVKENKLLQGLQGDFMAARYHSLAIQEETLPECLEVTAVADDGEIMAVQHKEYAVYGLQFHPESIMTPEGRTILANFLQLCK